MSRYVIYSPAVKNFSGVNTLDVFDSGDSPSSGLGTVLSSMKSSIKKSPLLMKKSRYPVIIRELDPINIAKNLASDRPVDHLKALIPVAIQLAPFVGVPSTLLALDASRALFPKSSRYYAPLSATISNFETNAENADELLGAAFAPIREHIPYDKITTPAKEYLIRKPWRAVKSGAGWIMDKVPVAG